MGQHLSDGIRYTGRRYVTPVPDTLDLAQRPELALNGLGGTMELFAVDAHYLPMFQRRAAIAK